MTIRGAHLYGFASPDSDVDLRGAFMHSAHELIVRRHDAAELDAIRDGALTFDELRATAARLQDELKRAGARTALPHEPDHERVDRLACELMTGHATSAAC